MTPRPRMGERDFLFGVGLALAAIIALIPFRTWLLDAIVYGLLIAVVLRMEGTPR